MTFDTLDTYEKEIAIQWLSDALVDGETDNAVHNVLWEMDYIRKPVSIEQFVGDEYYLGKVLSELHQSWKDDLIEVFKPGSQIGEWVMTGGIGIGKTTIATAAIAYILHRLSCLRNAQAYYGLLPDSMMVLGIYSITKRQVADTGYFKMRGFVDASPYFRDHFPRSKKIDSVMDFTKNDTNLKIVPGSTELHALGLDLFSFLMDEVNFMRERNDKDKGAMVGQAYDLYNSTYSRMMSRFLRPGGTVPGMMFLLSSRNSQTSFLEEHLSKVKNSASTYVSDYPLWACKPKSRFQLPWFRVEVGDRVSRSRILHDPEIDLIHGYINKRISMPDAQRLAAAVTDEQREKTRRNGRVETIPGEFLSRFEEDTNQALRDIAGVATFNLSPLISERQSIYDAAREQLTHPFTRHEVLLDTEDDVLLDEFFQVKVACRVKKGAWVPRVNPGKPRFIHIDLSLTGDCAGIAMGHVSGLVRHEKVNAEGVKSVVENPFIVIDFMLRINPPTNSEIDLSKIRAFVLFVRKLFPVARVTFDGFQSRDSIQILRKRPHQVETGLLSVDSTDDAYLSLRSALFDRRIAVYDYTPFVQEMLDLERDTKKRKVDHPVRSSHDPTRRGSKDVTDAVAGVVWHCINDERAEAAAPLIIGSEVARLTLSADPAVAEQERDDNKRRVNGKEVDWNGLRSNVLDV